MLAGLILDALFPDACLACLAPRDASFRHEVACEPCLRDVALPDFLSCVACSAASSSPRPACHPESPSRVALGSVEARVVGSLAAAARFGHMPRAIQPLSDLLAAATVSLGLPLHRTYLAPVPEPAALQRERGYDANLLLAEALALQLRVQLAPRLITLSRHAPHAYGIGDAGNAASADLVLAVSLASPSRSRALQCASLARSACPHADVALLACTA